MVTSSAFHAGEMGSIPVHGTVSVADMVMYRTVDPEYAGSNPVRHRLSLV